MLRIYILAASLLLCLTSSGQTTFDSLKRVYSAQRIFSNRSNGDVSDYIKEELNKIENISTRQLASCAIAENLHGYGWVKDKQLLSMVEKVIDNPEHENIRTIAMGVKNEIARTLVGSKIRDISLPNVIGDSIRLADYYSNKDYVVVDLWATWCGPCIAEMKKFNDFRKEYSNIEFYSISLDEDYSKVQRFMNRNKDYSWPIVWAGNDSPLWYYFKARLIPAFFIVDKNGMIISHVVGRGLEEELKKINKK